MSKLRIVSNAKSIKMKIIYSFMSLVLIVWVYATYNYFLTERLMEESQDIIDKEVYILSQAYELSNTIDVRLSSAYAYILTGDENYKTMFTSYAEKASEIKNSLKEFEDYKTIEKTMKYGGEWNAMIINDVFPLYEEGNVDGAIAMLTSLEAHGKEIHNEYEAFAKMKDQEIKENGNALTDNMHLGKMILVIISYALSVVAWAVGYAVARNIAKPIHRMMYRIEDISNGELNHEPLKITSKDETARLTVAANTMNDKIRSIVKNIQSGAVAVSQSSDSLKVATHEVKNGISLTTDAVEKIANGTDEQASLTSDLRNIMHNFTQNVQSAKENSLKVQSHSDSVQVMTDEGQKLINETEEQMYKIDTIVKQAVNRVESLNSQTREITQLVQVIKEIAEQTNLLALNAAIEAARAGDQGKGFAVVADEVRKLAEQVSRSVSNISTIVHTIQKETDIVTRSLVEGYGEVEKGTKQTHISSETYRNISKAVTEMVSNIKSVTHNLQNIATNTSSIDNAIENIATISEQSAASSQQTAATIQEVASSMESVAQNADLLNGTADKLQEVVKQFKL